ncbi:MAG: SDR family NAD(P)-dependent oxidoreductase [Acidobacteria bacterium]|nr:SDR family NAD(P)-dependent oxidoreductase [Acidobacteriota bacterium]
MDLKITGRVAMVAASSNGIGKAAALSLAKEGCRVSLCGRDRERLEKARGEIAALSSGDRVMAAPSGRDSRR